jgi:aspartyl-tRNA(Asn)/glutamyl-tRNA(Gln) amidotransferase subunit A
MSNCYAALGTDTGGSIRTPAAMCGVTGFKATYGRVSIRGIVPLTWSLDHCGPIARSAEDAAMVLQHIAGFDKLDLQCIDYPVPDYLQAVGASIANYRIGLPPMFFDGLDDEVARAMDDALALLNKLTKGSREVEMPNLLGTGANSEGTVFREALGGAFVSGDAPAAAGGGGGGGFSARAVDYIKEWRQLRLLRRMVDVDVFLKQNVDILLTPTIRHLPWTIEEELGRAANPTRTRHPEPGNTRALDNYGLPTMTIPCGVSKSGLPIGLQISGPNVQESKVIALAHAYQQATDWHKKVPPLQPDAKVPVLSKTAAGQTGEALAR